MTQPFVLLSVPLTDLDPPDVDIRDRTTSEYLDFLHRVLIPSIQQEGVKQPLVGFQNGKRVKLIDGLTRTHGMRLLGLEAAPVAVYPEKPADPELAVFLAVDQRRDLTPAERGRFYLATMRKHGWSLSQLAKRLGKNISTLYKRLAWMDYVPPEMHDKVGEGDGMIPERCAYALKNYPEEERREACERVMKGTLTAEAMEGKGKKRKPKQEKLEIEGVMIWYPAGMANALLAEKLKSMAGKLK